MQTTNSNATPHPWPPCIAFDGSKRIAEGPLPEVAREVAQLLFARPDAQVLLFDDDNSRPIEVDFRGTPEEVLGRLKATGTRETPATDETPRGPGRPKLGVVAREVTLLPRHWEWLAAQRGGASVALRKLVDDARRATSGQDHARAVQEAAYRFLHAMAGDLNNFEEACRAFFANEADRFAALSAAWPGDVRDHARKLAARSFEAWRGIEIAR